MTLSCLSLRWPVLKCPSLAGFQVSPEVFTGRIKHMHIGNGVSRRTFLGTSLLAMQRSFENIIDVHVHLWTNDFAKYPLAAEFKPTDMLRPRYLPQDVLR